MPRVIKKIFSSVVQRVRATGSEFRHALVEVAKEDW
jgi:hypothetical protein